MTPDEIIAQARQELFNRKAGDVGIGHAWHVTQLLFEKLDRQEMGIAREKELRMSAEGESLRQNVAAEACRVHFAALEKELACVNDDACAKAMQCRECESRLAALQAETNAFASVLVRCFAYLAAVIDRKTLNET